MVWRTMLICLFLLMSVGFTGAQQGEKMPAKFRVEVLVDGTDLTNTTEAESYLKRELRSLGDVEITDIGMGHYVLSVVMVEDIYKSSGTKTGRFSYSYMGVKRFNPFDLESKLPKQHFNTVFDATWNLYYYSPLHGVGTGAKRTELKQVCQQIVAKFDTRLLEPDRSKR